MDKILLVEDDNNLGYVVKDNLLLNGFKVELFKDGSAALKNFKIKKYDLCLLDVMLPKKDGFSLAKAIRNENKDIPIIFITAKSMIEDKSTGFQIGADDYITKPFSIKILLARIEAVLRRRLDQVEHDDEKALNISGIIIEPRRREVKVGGKRVEGLTFSEFQILFLLCSHPGWVFTRYQIIDKIRGDNYPVTDRSVDFQIVGLRKKLGDAGKLIKTVRGVGYRFTPDEK